MAKVNDGLTYGLDQFKFNNQVLGYISEEGLAWGGDKPEKVKINAAQVKAGPVKIITKNGGTNVITFKLIQLDGPHCEAVMGVKQRPMVRTLLPLQSLWKERQRLFAVADILFASAKVIFPPNSPVILMVAKYWLSTVNWK